MHIVVIYGPQGSGKTWNAEKFCKAYGCLAVLDGFSAGETPPRKLQDRDLILTNDHPSDLRATLPNAHLVSIKTALRRIGSEWSGLENHLIDEAIDKFVDKYGSEISLVDLRGFARVNFLRNISSSRLAARLNRKGYVKEGYRRIDTCPGKSLFYVPAINGDGGSK